jgi:hypothetical protein
MEQFYFLSIVMNLLAGLAIIITNAQDKGTPFDGIRHFFSDMTVRLVVGILAATIGLLKLIIVMRGDIPVIGDIIPAFAGIAGGTKLFLEFYQKNASVTTDTLDKLNTFFEKYGKTLGFTAVVAAILHFLIPQVVLL